jgi:hypothetical protein
MVTATSDAQNEMRKAISDVISSSHFPCMAERANLSCYQAVMKKVL